MPRLRNIVPRDYFKAFECADQGLLAHLTREGSGAWTKVTSLSKSTFYSYCSRTNPRTVHSLARDIIQECAPTYFVTFLNDIDNSEEFYGVVSERILEGFKDLVPDLKETTATEDLGRYFYNVILTEANPSGFDNGCEEQIDDSADISVSNEADWSLYELKEKINRHKPLYVQTKIFQKALQTLKNNRRVLIVGEPGAGKSITSEMIADDFINNGFEVKYSVQTDNLTSIITDIKANPDVKQLVFVDDCFGQIVMDLCSEQENDLRKLAIITRYNKNKYLLLNSRIAIIQGVLYSEKPLKTILSDIRNEKSIVYIENITDLEKAQILYNHLLYMPDVKNEHYQNLRDNENYLKIIRHKNYNPRIIEHVTQGFFLSEVEPNEYYDKIIATLDNPEIIWNWEYNNRLSLPQRLLLTTLCSFGNQGTEINRVKTAFFKRISFEPLIDKSKDNWLEAVSVLNGAMVKIYASYGNKRFMEVINPSVNDFLLKNVLFKGSPEVDMIKKAAAYPLQIMRTCGDEAAIVFKKKLEDGSIKEMIFSDGSQEEIILSYYIAINGICRKEYKAIITSFISHLEQFGAYNTIKNTLCPVSR